MGQLVDKLSILVGQMQKFLDRPAQVIYQQSSGPAREGGKGGGKRPSRNISDAQNSTLKDIFQNNLDLRRSLQKLADTVTPAAGTPATNGTPANGTPTAIATPVEQDLTPIDLSTFDAEPTPSPDAGSPTESQAATDQDVMSSAEAAGEESSHDVSMRVHDGDRSRHAQPAA
jgi:hypothetical protein